jgi:hypothetical protein
MPVEPLPDAVESRDDWSFHCDGVAIIIDFDRKHDHAHRAKASRCRHPVLAFVVVRGADWVLDALDVENGKSFGGRIAHVDTSKAEAST